MPLNPDASVNNAYLARTALSTAIKRADQATADPAAPDADITAITGVVHAGVAIANAMLAINTTLARLGQQAATVPLDT